MRRASHGRWDGVQQGKKGPRTIDSPRAARAEPGGSWALDLVGWEGHGQGRARVLPRLPRALPRGRRDLRMILTMPLDTPLSVYGQFLGIVAAWLVLFCIAGFLLAHITTKMDDARRKTK